MSKSPLYYQIYEILSDPAKYKKWESNLEKPTDYENKYDARFNMNMSYGGSSSSSRGNINVISVGSSSSSMSRIGPIVLGFK